MLSNFRSYQLAVQFYRATRSIKAPAGLKDQLNRAASSIALNLAEGTGKTSQKDRLRFYEIALASTRECEALFDLLYPQAQDLRPHLDSLARHVCKLCMALR